MANARKAAVNALLSVDKDGCYSNIAVDNAIKNAKLEGAYASFCSALIYGVLERRNALDYFISKCSSKPLNKLSLFVVEVLRISVLQLKYMDKIPPFAAINEAVNLIKKSKEHYASGFVNAVLRAVVKQNIDLPAPIDAKSISITDSCDISIADRIVECFGVESAHNILKPNDNPLPIYIRCNTVKCTVEKLAEDLENSGVVVEYVDNMPNTLAVRGSLEHTNAFKSGWFHVQDLACQLACESLMIEEGMYALDVCAAPGGKSFTLAGIINNKGKIVSCDIHPHRVKLIQNGANRLGLNCVEAKLNDGTVYNEELGLFDRVLCDVPCSGVGVIHRKPDIRYKKANEFDSLPQLQYDILKTSAKYVKRGGVIVYSTCTLFSEENEAVFERFLNENDDFEPFPFENGSYINTILPNGKKDGFFFARAKRKEE